MSAVAGMMQGLEKALARAHLADDRELAGRVREEGRRLVFLLNGLIRMTRMYDPENAAFDSPSRDLVGALKGLLELLGAVHVICVEDQIYVNDIRLRLGVSEQTVVDGFIGELERHRVGGISFHGELDADQAKFLAHVLARPSSDSARPRAALSAELAAMHAVELTGTYRFKISGETTARAKDVEEAVRRCEKVVREAVQNLAADRMPNPLPVRRAVIELVDALKGDPSAGLAAPGRRHSGPHGEQHLTSVSSLAVVLGHALGLDESALSDLGVAAMLHDIGSTARSDWTGHTSAGARILMKQRGFHEAKIRRILLALEHHLPYRHGDAPVTTDGEDTPSLFARIVHIVDDYDILTARQPGQHAPMSPARAIGSMWAVRGTAYDPDLLAVFVGLLGRYPPGTLFELSDGRWAVSVSGGRDRERFACPVARIVREADGTMRPATESLDLYEMRQVVQPRLVLDVAIEAEESVGSMVEGALRNPLAPEPGVLS